MHLYVFGDSCSLTLLEHHLKATQKKTDKIPRILEQILVHGLKVRFDRCAMSDFTLTRALDNVSSSTTGAVFVRL